MAKTQKKTRMQNRGFALIIVVFAIMLLAVLGWSLSIMQATDFEANTRNLESENARLLAEAGMEWAFENLILGKITQSADCNNASSWRTHTFGPGQYQVCCRDPSALETTVTVVIESNGYVPLAPPPVSNYRTLSKVKLGLVLGSFNKVLQASDRFDWSATTNSSSLQGDIQAANYNQDNTLPDNQAADLAVPGNNGDQRKIAAEPYPSIDMSAFKTAAGSRVWPENYTEKQATITVITDNGNSVDITVSPAIFGDPSTQWANNIVRNLSTGGGWNSPDWRIISSRISSNKINVPDNGLNWAINNIIQIGRRYTKDDTNGDLKNKTLWYIQGDVLFDVTADKIDIKKTAIVAEGDIVIKGAKEIKVSEKPDTYPSLATQNGNILSEDTPEGGNDAQRRQNRSFGSLIYTQNGEVKFNYLDAESVMGNKVTFSGEVKLKYDSKVMNVVNFTWSLAEYNWQEQQ